MGGSTEDQLDLAVRWRGLLGARRRLLLDAARCPLTPETENLALLRDVGVLRTLGYLTGAGREPASLTPLGNRLAAFGCAAGAIGAETPDRAETRAGADSNKRGDGHAGRRQANRRSWGGHG